MLDVYSLVHDLGLRSSGVFFLSSLFFTNELCSVIKDNNFQSQIPIIGMHIADPKHLSRLYIYLQLRGKGQQEKASGKGNS